MVENKEDSYIKSLEFLQDLTAELMSLESEEQWVKENSWFTLAVLGRRNSLCKEYMQSQLCVLASTAIWYYYIKFKAQRVWCSERRIGGEMTIKIFFLLSLPTVHKFQKKYCARKHFYHRIPIYAMKNDKTQALEKLGLISMNKF